MLASPHRRTARRPHRRTTSTISRPTLPCSHRNPSLPRCCDDQLNPPMTPPALWRGSRPGCATRSTWKCSRPSCWRWSSGRYSRLGRRCGYARRSPRGRRGSTVITGQHDSHPNTQGPGNVRVGDMVVEDAPAVTPSGRRPHPDLPGRPHRRGVPWICNAAPAGPCPPAWRVGRSPATRPRAVTPGDPPDDPSARGDQPHGRIGDRQGP